MTNDLIALGLGKDQFSEIISKSPKYYIWDWIDSVKNKILHNSTVIKIFVLCSISSK